MAAFYLWLYCCSTFLYCAIAKDFNVKLLIKPQQKNNIKIFDVYDVIDYVCDAAEIPNNGIFLYWYMKKYDGTLSLKVRNDILAEKKSHLRYKVNLTSEFDLSEIFCIARKLENNKYFEIGTSESILLVLNRSRDRRISNNNGVTEETLLNVTIDESNRNCLNKECDDFDNYLTALIVVSVIATIIVIILVLVIFYLHRRRDVSNKVTRDLLQESSCSHENSTYMATLQPEVVSNIVNEYAEPILPSNKIYVNC